MKTYWLNISGMEIGDNVVAPYHNKKDLARNWRKDAADFLREAGVDANDRTAWMPYFQVEEKNGDMDEISYDKLFERSVA
jgi:hypothetical protein